MNDKVSEEDFFKLVWIFILVTAFVFLGGVWIVVLLRHVRPNYFLKSNFKNLLKVAVATLFLAVVVFAISRRFGHSGYIQITASMLSLWLIGASGALLTSPIWTSLFRKKAVTVADFKLRTKRIKNVNFGSRRNNGKDNSNGDSLTSDALIGWSMRSGEEICLDQKQRTMHTLVAGSTGSGKTTLLESLYLDAVSKKQSVLIIDPKGNIATLTKLKNLALQAGYKENRFFTISIINPEMSDTYNPIEAGTIMQKVNRIMGAMQWSESFYKDQSFSWLIKVLETLTAAKVPITIRNIFKMGSDKKFALGVVSKLKEDEVNRPLFESFNRVMKENLPNITGLLAQLQQLDNDEFGQIFEPPKEETQRNFSLQSLLSEHGVGYFQLNVMAYQESAKVLGKLILQDIKGLASDIHAGKITVSQKFFPIFIDEFGSFAIEGFIDFLKMCRDVGFANHLFFQSLADLDVVSESFKSQVQQNCSTKIVMRTDDPKEVDFWSSVAGTQDAVENSYQVMTFGNFRLRTGMGNARMTKQMFVEHDVFKQLSIGEAVLIQKAPFRCDLIQLWWPKF